jgi:hypothetical protein
MQSLVALSSSNPAVCPLLVVCYYLWQLRGRVSHRSNKEVCDEVKLEYHSKPGHARLIRLKRRRGYHALIHSLNLGKLMTNLENTGFVQKRNIVVLYSLRLQHFTAISSSFFSSERSSRISGVLAGLYLSDVIHHFWGIEISQMCIFLIVVPSQRIVNGSSFWGFRDATVSPVGKGGRFSIGPAWANSRFHPAAW